ncbi:MAG: hypothetical protein H0V25_06960 [Solirubrobacterales bacterium]|nr:hypothetical protein [Solirubrobacterales bacterium]
MTAVLNSAVPFVTAPTGSTALVRAARSIVSSEALAFSRSFTGVVGTDTVEHDPTFLVRVNFTGTMLLVLVKFDCMLSDRQYAPLKESVWAALRTELHLDEADFAVVISWH